MENCNLSNQVLHENTELEGTTSENLFLTRKLRLKRKGANTEDGEDLWELEKIKSSYDVKFMDNPEIRARHASGKCEMLINEDDVENENIVNVKMVRRNHNNLELQKRKKRLNVFHDKHVADGLVSLLLSRIKGVSLWDENDIRNIISLGDQFYDSQGDSATSQNYSCVSELPKTIKLFEKNFQISLWKSYIGDLETITETGTRKNEGAASISFHTTLKRSLCGGFSGALIALGDYMYSVLPQENHFYLFDPQIEKISHFVNIPEIYEHCCALVKSRIMPGNAKFVVSALSVDIVSQADAAEEEGRPSRGSPGPKYEEEVIQNKSSDLQNVVCEPHILLFQPLSNQDREALCSRLNMVNQYHGEDFDGCSAMGEIIETYPVARDNDTLFRAISYAISGTEVHHRRLRLQVVKHIQCKENIFKPFLNLNYSSIQQYINETGMKYLGTQTTELELYGIADLLQTEVNVLGNGWMQYSVLENSELEHQAVGSIYLKCCHGSYEVILKIKKEEDKVDETVTQEYYPEEAGKISETVAVNQPEDIPSFVPMRETSEQEIQMADSFSEESSFCSTAFSEQDNQNRKGRKKRTNGTRKQEYNAKRRRQAYEKYWNNEEFRVKKREEARNRYRLYGGCLKGILNSEDNDGNNLPETPNVTAKKKKQSERYKNDEEYRVNKLKKAWERYHSDENYREKKKVYNKNKYHSDEEYRERVRNYSKLNYERNKRKGKRRELT